MIYWVVHEVEFYIPVLVHKVQGSLVIKRCVVSLEKGACVNIQSSESGIFLVKEKGMASHVKGFFSVIF